MKQSLIATTNARQPAGTIRAEKQSLSAMKQSTKRITCLAVTLTLVLGLFPSNALATHTPDPTTNCSTIVGEYTFVSNEGFGHEGASIERTRTFAYNDEWFMGPSSTFNQHLATLSAIACETSVSYYPDAKERDNSNNSKNVKPFLEALKFENVEVNKAYDREKLAYTVGVALGHKTIVQEGKEYTLLAIIPRSAAYKQEWDGNFTVSAGNLHSGFLAARDEILRFTKQYVESHGISGDVKVWTTGHSRGSAVANLVGAFFAAGGASNYLGGISVAAEDVYDYTFATPTTVIESGASMAELLSVAAAQSHSSDTRYAENETAGAGYAYAGTDAATKLDPHSAPFAGIHNIAPDYDIITLLPPLDWDFTHYGSYSDLEEGASTDQMLGALSELDPFIYSKYISDGKEEDPTWTGHEEFSWKTFDLDNLELVDDASAGAISQGEFFKARVSGLTRMAPTSGAYVSTTAEETLKALAGIYGMNEAYFGNVGTWTQDKETTIKAAIFSYLAYAAERYAQEGVTTDEDEAVARALEGIVAYVTQADGVETGGATTVDKIIYELSCYIMDRVELDAEFDTSGFPTINDYSFKSNAIEKLVDFVDDALIKAVPASYQSIFNIDDSMTDDEKKKALNCSFLLRLLYLSAADEENGRLTLYGFLALADSLHLIEGVSLGSILGADEYDTPNGSNTTTQMVAALHDVLLVEKDDEGAETARYASFADAADEYVKRVLESSVGVILASGHFDEGTLFYNDIVSYKETLQKNARVLRLILLDLLLYEQDQPFNAAANVRNVATFLAQANHVPTAHYNETYLAWMLAKDSAYPAHLHELVHTAAVAPTCTEAGRSEYWQCSVCGLYFADENAAKEIDLEDTVAEALGHKWGAWTETKAATLTEEGEETRVCEHDTSHKETRPIPKLDAVTYTITYDLAGGTLNGDEGPITQDYEEGTAITILDAPELNGYTFQYWEGSKYMPGDEYVVVEDHTFTAVWTKDEESGGVRWRHQG